MNMYEEFVEISKKLRKIESEFNQNNILMSAMEACVKDSVARVLRTEERMDKLEKKLGVTTNTTVDVIQVGNNTTLSQEVKPEIRGFNVSNVEAKSKAFW